MKTRITPALSLALLCAAGLGPQASAGIFDNNINMLAVAERTQAAPAQQDNPVSYIAFDAGYIEAGDPIAGDTPPTADQVAQSLNAALSEHGFRAAQGTPSIVLTYHWGVLRVDHRQIKLPYGIKTNLIARIELVSTQELGAEVENHILGRERAGGLNDNASAPTLLVGPLETIRQDSREPRIFVIVSAYDYPALVHREARLVWRAKLSAQETSGEMRQVIPALIAGGARFFGKNYTDIQDISAPLTPPVQAAAAAAVARPSPESFQLDKDFIDGLLRQERARFSGMGADGGS